MYNNETQQVGILDSYFITSSGDGSNTSVVGSCLMAVNHETVKFSWTLQ